jgi:hypothetical protein
MNALSSVAREYGKPASSVRVFFAKSWQTVVAPVYLAIPAWQPPAETD